MTGTAPVGRALLTAACHASGIDPAPLARLADTETAVIVAAMIRRAHRAGCTGHAPGAAIQAHLSASRGAA